jgi:hypothetical protein
MTLGMTKKAKKTGMIVISLLLFLAFFAFLAKAGQERESDGTAQPTSPINKKTKSDKFINAKSDEKAIKLNECLRAAQKPGAVVPAAVAMRMCYNRYGVVTSR